MFKNINDQLREPRLFLLLTLLLVMALLIFYFVSSMITSIGYQAFSQADSPVLTDEKNVTIILDAGHGGEDPGAVGNGIVEKDLNLSVVHKIKDYLTLSGFNIILTRCDDRLLYNDGEENQKKYYDLYNRSKIAETYENSIFISIHMNKYPLESCKGLQTFYSLNDSSSELLAKSVQKASCMLTPTNKRQIKPDQGTIFLLKNIKMPAILVECGFLSNREESLNLSKKDYQNKLAFSISCGIINFIKERQNNNHENKLYLQ